MLDVCSDPSKWPHPAGGDGAGEGGATKLWDAVICSNMIHISPQVRSASAVQLWSREVASRVGVSVQVSEVRYRLNSLRSCITQSDRRSCSSRQPPGNMSAETSLGFACVLPAKTDLLYVFWLTSIFRLTTHARVTSLAVLFYFVFVTRQQECTRGLLKGASAGLKAGGYLFVYGPFALNGILIPDSNKSFDESLKARSGGSWGIRDVAWVASLADEQGLELKAMTLMPANNFFVVFTKVRFCLSLYSQCHELESIWFRVSWRGRLRCCAAWLCSGCNTTCSTEVSAVYHGILSRKAAEKLIS